MEMLFKIKRAALIIGLPGPDKLSLYPDIGTPFPEMKYEACLSMDIRKGYGVEYCREVLGIEVEVIDASKMQSRCLA